MNSSLALNVCFDNGGCFEAVEAVVGGGVNLLRRLLPRPVVWIAVSK